MYSKTYSNSIVVVEYFFHEYEYEYDVQKNVLEYEYEYKNEYSNSIVVVEYFFHEYEDEYEYRKMYWSTSMSMSTTTLKYIHFTTRSMVFRWEKPGVIITKTFNGWIFTWLCDVLDKHSFSK